MSELTHIRLSLELYEARYPDLSGVYTTPEIEEAEEMWAGGIADFGDPRAARVIVRVPGYRQYLKSLKQVLKKSLGSRWTMYRALSEDEAEDMQTGGALGPKGYTMRLQVAKDWKRFAAHKTPEKIVIVKANVVPEMVIMRGKPEEAELVLDTHWDPGDMSHPL